jgi:hypothetical protein
VGEEAGWERGVGAPLLPVGGLPPITTHSFLILPVALCVKTLAKRGRDFPWRRPKRCPRCQGPRLWGHGFVSRYFEGFCEPLSLRRYRCPDCGVVLCLRPAGYWKRFQSSIETIRRVLFHRLRTGRWPPGSHPPRGRHWLRGLRRQVPAHLGMRWVHKLAQGFEQLVVLGRCAVSRSV